MGIGYLASNSCRTSEITFRRCAEPPEAFENLNALSIRVKHGCIKQTLLHRLFPVVRAEVLRLLFTNPGQELYTRELARLSFLALRTIQDEVAKLEAAKLIVSRSNG